MGKRPRSRTIIGRRRAGYTCDRATVDCSPWALDFGLGCRLPSLVGLRSSTATLDDAMSFWRRLRKKVLKRRVASGFFPAMRPPLLRWCGFSVGPDVYIADGLIIVEELADRGNLIIGARVSIAPRVTIVTSSHPNDSRIRTVAPVAKGPVHIEDDAWIGTGAVILPGVRIGRGAVVGANAVVTRDVPPLTIVAGHPAEAVRSLTPPKEWEQA